MMNKLYARRGGKSWASKYLKEMGFNVVESDGLLCNGGLSAINFWINDAYKSVLENPMGDGWPKLKEEL